MVFVYEIEASIINMHFLGSEETFFLPYWCIQFGEMTDWEQKKINNRKKNKTKLVAFDIRHACFFSSIRVNEKFR